MTCTWVTHQESVPAVARVLFEWTGGCWDGLVGEPQVEDVCARHLNLLVRDDAVRLHEVQGTARLIESER